MQTRPKEFSTVEQSDVLTCFDRSAADCLLYNLATVMMKQAGHRYGTFLDSASTAAKMTIYSTYIEKDRSFRKTGNFYHIESKRIKAIVKEIEELLLNSGSLKILGSEEPSYLIDFPHLWLKTYPCQPGQSRFPSCGLTASEKQAIEEKLPASMPPVRLIRGIELDHLLRLLYEQATETIAVARWQHCSDPLLEHLKCRLLDAQTIVRVDSSSQLTSLYALTRVSYSPKGRHRRLSNLIQDVTRFFKLLLLWLEEDPSVLRAVETFEIDPEKEQEALAEMDTFFRSWADKYHQEGGKPMLLQAAIGPDDNPYFTKNKANAVEK